ncbi:DUF6596 domain-containing protein [Flavobacterium ginsengiterrae]|uniref:Sigma factor n=1 Tax=Flavobacterium ginsengiterrae TaxID=871695 RepID=A0ABP7G5H2_9FLAO
MNDSVFQKDQTDYRALSGRLFSALLSRFGTDYISEIEDAVQNSFLKSLKISDHKKKPDNLENWLFIVARNDVLNQIKAKKEKHDTDGFLPEQGDQPADQQKDLRLQTILFIASMDIISAQSKIIFILKNIFGLSVAEIHSCTLLSEEAIYKSAGRTRKSIRQQYHSKPIDLHFIGKKKETAIIGEEILYSVFNIGFDSFSEKTQDIVNIDLCLEVFSLARLLLNEFKLDSTSNLLAVFSLHTARIPAKIENGKLIPFFDQNRSKWNAELFQLGVLYLKKPKIETRFYIEALIALKYMTVETFGENDWNDIINLYKLLQRISPSPIVKLNYCYCLSKTGNTKAALEMLAEVEKELPDRHVYFNIIKAKIMSETNPAESADLFNSVVNDLNQKIRKEHLLENELIRL